MNANELADELVGLIVAPTPVDDKWACELIDKAATMLRQQQAKIEILKKAFETACDGMETSLELNKAQAERYWSEKR